MVLVDPTFEFVEFPAGGGVNFQISKLAFQVSIPGFQFPKASIEHPILLLKHPLNAFQDSLGSIVQDFSDNSTNILLGN